MRNVLGTDEENKDEFAYETISIITVCFCIIFVFRFSAEPFCYA